MNADIITVRFTQMCLLKGSVLNQCAEFTEIWPCLSDCARRDMTLPMQVHPLYQHYVPL